MFSALDANRNENKPYFEGNKERKKERNPREVKNNKTKQKTLRLSLYEDCNEILRLFEGVRVVF